MITTELRRHDLVGNGTAGPFTYQFLIRDKTHLLVYVDANLKTVDTHYTVSGVGSESGGTVTFTAGNEPAANAEIILRGREPVTQTTDYIDAGSFPAASHEEALDKLTRLLTEVKETLGRVPVLALPDHYNKSAITLDELVAGQYVRANPTADGLEFAVPVTTPAGLPVGGNYDALTINGSGVVTWDSQIYNYAPNWVNISRYASLSAAVSAIGAVTKTTLEITTSQTIAGNVTVTANITLSFMGAGDLNVNTGITVTIQAKDFHVDHDRRQVFRGLGTVLFTDVQEVRPESWWDGSGDALTAIQQAVNSLPATGGTIKFFSGTYNISNQIVPTKFVRFQGAGMDQTILQLTANAALRCGIKSVSAGFAVFDLTVKTQTPPTTNEQMSAIRCDLFGTAVAVGQQVHIENVKVRGFNIGIFSDGDTARRITHVTYRNVDVQCSGPAADYIGSCLHVHRVLKCVIDAFDLDKNNTGEHGAYFSEIENLRFSGGKIRNATRGGAWGIKMVSNVAGQFQSVWSFEDLDLEDCTSGIQAALFLDNTLDNLKIQNVRFKDIGKVVGQAGCITVDLSGTSRIRHADIRGNTLNNLQQQGVAFQGGAGTEVTNAVVDGLQAFNWSIDSAGTHALIASTGTTLVLRQLALLNIYANGNTTNGRCIVDQGSLQSSVKRAVFSGLKQELCTVQGLPIVFVDGDTTPSVALGNVFYVNNTGATNVSRLDDMVAGEVYTLIFANGNTTLVDSATLANAGSVNITPGSTDVYTYTTFDGTNAVMVSGSNN